MPTFEKLCTVIRSGLVETALERAIGGKYVGIESTEMTRDSLIAFIHGEQGPSLLDIVAAMSSWFYTEDGYIMERIGEQKTSDPEHYNGRIFANDPDSEGYVNISITWPYTGKHTRLISDTPVPSIWLSFVVIERSSNTQE